MYPNKRGSLSIRHRDETVVKEVFFSRTQSGTRDAEEWACQEAWRLASTDASTFYRTTRHYTVRDDAEGRLIYEVEITERDYRKETQ